MRRLENNACDEMPLERIRVPQLLGLVYSLASPPMEPMIVNIVSLDRSLAYTFRMFPASRHDPRYLHNEKDLCTKSTVHALAALTSTICLQVIHNLSFAYLAR
eukprot:119065_1